jgi:hypothetical protein
LILSELFSAQHETKRNLRNSQKAATMRIVPLREGWSCIISEENSSEQNQSSHGRKSSLAS